jgi:hypothetical protein
VDGLKRKHKHQIKKIMSNFQLNFNSPKKVVSITLDEEEGIFQLAYLFKKLLDDAGIPNKLEEKDVEVVEATEVGNEKLD